MMIYMYAVWHDLDLSRGTHLAGEIVYPDQERQDRRPAPYTEDSSTTWAR